MVSHYRSLSNPVKASFWFLICSFLQKGISVITTPVFTRLLSTAEYGQYSVFNSWYGIALILIALSLSAGVHSQGIVKYEEERDVFTSSLLGLTLTSAAVWTLVYFLFRTYWNNTLGLTTVQVLCMLSLVLTTSIFNFWANGERVDFKYKTLVIVTLLVSVFKPLLSILFITHSQDKVTARILGIVIVELLAYGWMCCVQMRKGKTFFSKKYWLYALAFNLPLIPHYLSQTVLNSADRIMIERMIGASEAGIYNLAYSIALIMTLFNTALMQTISPWMYRKIKEKKEKDIAPIAYSTLIIIAVVNLLLILMAPEIVAVFAPKPYYQAIWVIPPIALSAFFMYAYDLFAKFAFYYEKTGFIMIASVVGATVNVILNYFFIQKYGFIAAGYTTLVCFILYALGHYVFMQKVCREFCEKRYPYETITIVFIALPFIALGFALLFTYNHPVLRYSVFLTALVFCAVCRKKILSMFNRVLCLKKEK